MVLATVVAMGVGLALLLVRRSPGIDPDSEALKAEMEGLERYRFRRPDGQDKAEYRRLMRRQLIEVKRDFLRFSNVCRLRAPYSQDPDFATTLVNQFTTFHCLLDPVVDRDIRLAV